MPKKKTLEEARAEAVALGKAWEAIRDRARVTSEAARKAQARADKAQARADDKTALAVDDRVAERSALLRYATAWDRYIAMKEEGKKP